MRCAPLDLLNFKVVIFGDSDMGLDHGHDGIYLDGLTYERVEL